MGKMTKEELALRNLLEMLRYRRPHGSRSERRFINRFLRPLGVHQDAFGNYWKRINCANDVPSNILWSSHIDTVHRHSGKQEILHLEEDNTVALRANRHSNCLGADCTVGVWLMREMILAGVPGLYVFHRAEESGCKGSRWIAQNNREFLDGIDIAIAFDRRGTHSIITHQSFSRTCSDAFAWNLASKLGMGHKPDDGGIFTDTASYADIVPECTNISVGYDNEHTTRETLNVQYAMRLREALLEADFSDLLVVRDPSIIDYADYTTRYTYQVTGHKRREYDFTGDYEPDYEWTSLVDVVREYPYEIAAILEDLGYTSAQVLKEIRAMYGEQSQDNVTYIG